MGYFSSGIAFWSEPDWKQLDDLPAEIKMRGYKQKNAPLWLLEFTTERESPEYPFTRGREASVFSKFCRDTTTECLEKLSNCLEAYGGDWLGFALEVARYTGKELYLFAADDEFYDLGARVRADSVQQLALSIELHKVDADDGSFNIELGYEDEEEVEALEEIVQDLRRFDFVSNVSIVERVEGLDFYGNVVSLWPPEAGDPEELLGLGTWDPFDGIEETLILEYERESQVPTSQPVHATEVASVSLSHTEKKPWWKFWK